MMLSQPPAGAAAQPCPPRPDLPDRGDWSRVPPLLPPHPPHQEAQHQHGHVPGQPLCSGAPPAPCLSPARADQGPADPGVQGRRRLQDQGIHQDADSSSLCHQSGCSELGEVQTLSV